MKRINEYFDYETIMSYINQTELDNRLEQAEFSGSIHVTKNGNVLYQKSMGYADYETHTPFTINTSIELASLSKQFTAVAIMSLIEQGKLQLGDTIDKFLPEYEYSKIITVRHLLNHTSGIVDYSGEILVPNAIKQREIDLGRKFNSTHEANEFVCSLCRAYSLHECLDLVKGRPLHFAPGEGTAYSNTNYHFLSDIIERITDMSFQEYIVNNIFKVLGMNNSNTNGLNADAKGYIIDEFGTMLTCGRHGMHSGDSGVVSCVKDMECWCFAVLNGSLLRQESWNQCFNIVNGRYGFGFEKFDNWIGHNGGMPGISNRIRLHLPSKTSVILLSNKVNSEFNSTNELLQYIIQQV